ncbi:hypothetical protein D0T84_10965 [Dysgonomonas sp. 521]|uniref:hypothetical protein n=1 Tax=Dysgonomonas sp. 521 TaxID=2302932 RepID=UPI0013CF8424|nr:hypothetical protein [Dysgonomonas sp. 521]NDV95432.1 hypothetical protein [Dysgonomonas sp. 521]
MKGIYIIILFAFTALSAYPQFGKGVKIEKDIFGYLQYESNNNQKASLKKDVFDAWIYTDNRNNEVEFSKEYWNDILRDFKQNDTKAFMWLIDMCAELSNYKEKYKIDIFGYQQYENNQQEKASLKKDIFDKMIYEDSRGNKIEFSENLWRKMIKKRRSDKKVFMDLVQRYLFSD